MIHCSTDDRVVVNDKLNANEMSETKYTYLKKKHPDKIVFTTDSLRKIN